MTKLILAATEVYQATTKDQALGYHKYEINASVFQDYFKGKDYPSHSLKFHYKNVNLVAAAQASVSCRIMFSFLYSNC